VEIGLRPSERELVEAMALHGPVGADAAVRRSNPGRARKDGVARRVDPALPPPPSIGTVKVSRVSDGFEVMAYFRDEHSNTRQAGYVIVRALPKAADRCAADFDALARRLRLPRMGRMRVTAAFVDEEWQNRRLGLALYATALREASSNYGSALAPDECGPSGSTSPRARDVWNSSALRSLAEIEGEAFYWKGPKA